MRRLADEAGRGKSVLLPHPLPPQDPQHSRNSSQASPPNLCRHHLESCCAQGHKRWLNTEMCALTVLGLEVGDQGVPGPCSLHRLQGRVLPTSSSSWACGASLQSLSLTLSSYGHPCVSVPFCVSYKDICQWILGLLHNPGWSLHLQILNHICKEPFSK